MWSFFNDLLLGIRKHSLIFFLSPNWHTTKKSWQIWVTTIHVQVISDDADHGTQLVSTDYSLHPLVIGDGFEKDDISVNFVNPISRRMSGTTKKISIAVLHKILRQNFVGDCGTFPSWFCWVPYGLNKAWCRTNDVMFKFEMVRGCVWQLNLSL